MEDKWVITPITACEPMTYEAVDPIPRIGRPKRDRTKKQSTAQGKKKAAPEA